MKYKTLKTTSLYSRQPWYHRMIPPQVVLQLLLWLWYHRMIPLQVVLLLCSGTTVAVVLLSAIMGRASMNWFTLNCTKQRLHPVNSWKKNSPFPKGAWRRWARSQDTDDAAPGEPLLSERDRSLRGSPCRWLFGGYRDTWQTKDSLCSCGGWTCSCRYSPCRTAEEMPRWFCCSSPCRRGLSSSLSNAPSGALHPETVPVYSATTTEEGEHETWTITSKLRVVSNMNHEWVCACVWGHITPLFQPW